MSLEYAPFGNTWVCREKDQIPKAEWRDCPLDDIPAEAISNHLKMLARHERVALHGYDPEDPPAPFARIIRAEG